MRALQGSGLSQVRACAIVGQPRRTLHYHGQAKDDSALAERIQTLAQERPRWGWRRLLIMVRRGGAEVGEFRFRRIYCSLALQVRPRKKRKVRYVRGNVVPAVTRPNERWSIDFVHDRLANGRNIRAIAMVDDCTRECLALEIGFSFGSHDVIRCFEDLAFERGFPETIRFDNELSSNVNTLSSIAKRRASEGRPKSESRTRDPDDAIAPTMMTQGL